VSSFTTLITMLMTLPAEWSTRTSSRDLNKKLSLVFNRSASNITRQHLSRSTSQIFMRRKHYLPLCTANCMSPTCTPKSVLYCLLSAASASARETEDSKSLKEHTHSMLEQEMMDYLPMMASVERAAITFTPSLCARPTRPKSSSGCSSYQLDHKSLNSLSSQTPQGWS